MKIKSTYTMSFRDVRVIRKQHGFTLIELLVVIGLISVLAAGIGISIGSGGNSTSSLRAGQNTIVGLMSAARGQAALTQSNAMILVDVTDAESDECLRALQIVVHSGGGPNEWRPVGEPVLLPQGIYVVPPSGSSIPGVSLDGSWTSQRASSGLETAPPLTERDYADPDYPYYPTGAFTGRTYLKFQEFSPLGTTNGAGTLLVTTGKRSGPTQISLDNPQALRGVKVSRYGVPTLINEAETFDSN